MRLSTPMHDALIAAARNPLRRTHDDTAGAPPWPAPPSTLAALTRHQLLVRTELRNRRGFKVTVWTITDHGHDILNPPPRFRPDRPLFLAHCGSVRYRTLPTGRQVIAGGQGSGDYTTNPAKAIDPLEVVDPADIQRFSVTAREREQQRRREAGEALDAQAFEARLENVRMAARARRMDVSGEVWMIRQMAGAGRDQSAARRLAKLEAQLQQRAA